MTNLFSDIIDLSSVRSLMESLQEATGIPASLLDHEGHVLVAAGWQDVCGIYHRRHLETAERCRESDLFFARFLRDNDLPEEGYIRHTCGNGLIEIGLPIVINDVHFATLLFGQFILEPVDFDLFRRAAADNGFDEEAYLAAIARVPVFDPALVEKLLAVYAGIVELLIRLGRTRIEEVRARQELERSEQKFRDLFNNSSDAIYIVSLDGKILEVNQVACQRQGYTGDELRGMPVTELDDPAYAARVKDRLARFRQGKNVIFESAHLHRDGTPIPVEISGRVIDFEGEQAIMASARDLREREDAMQALQRSEVRFRSIIDSSPMGVHLYYLDPEDRLIFTGANAAADAILDIPHADLVGKTITEAFPGLTDSDIPRIYRDICREGGSWRSEQVDYEDARIRGAYEVHAFQTAPKTMAVFFLEITDRKKAEQALRESEEKYRLLFSAEKDAILIIDSADLGIVEVNSAALQMYGYSQEEFGRMQALDLSAEPLQSRERIAAVLDGRLDLMEARHRKRDGTTFPVEITAGTFRWRESQMLVAIIRDISERERITRMKDEMLSSISHEMRTPLTAILGFNELLMQESIDPEKARQFLELSYQEGERLRELIDDLLDLQRLRAGFVGSQFAPVAIRPLLQEIAGIFRDVTQKHDISVTCPDDLPEIVADEQKIHRVLKNLMSNAVKYSPGGGPIKLSARHRKQKAVVSIAVADKGLGIPEEARDQLFDRFFRVYHPEIKNIGGTGLGLALVREIVNIHGGEVRVESAPGRGSTFTIDLPVSGPSARV